MLTFQLVLQEELGGYKVVLKCDSEQEFAALQSNARQAGGTLSLLPVLSLMLLSSSHALAIYTSGCPDTHNGLWLGDSLTARADHQEHLERLMPTQSGSFASAKSPHHISRTCLRTRTLVQQMARSGTARRERHCMSVGDHHTCCSSACRHMP